MGIAEVTFDFKARSAAELTIKKGQHVEILKKTDSVGWWRGRIRGTQDTGLFPSNYTTVLYSIKEEDVARTDKGSIKMNAAQTKAFLEAQKKREDEKAARKKEKEERRRQKEKDREKRDKDKDRKDRDRDDKKEKKDKKDKHRDGGDGGDTVTIATVMFDFDARKDEEISIKRGEAVLVVERGSKNGWWKGQQPNDGKIGLLPSNYCRISEKPASEWKPNDEYDAKKVRKVEKLKDKLANVERKARDKSKKRDDDDDSDVRSHEGDTKEVKRLRDRIKKLKRDVQKKRERLALLEEKVAVSESLIEQYDALLEGGERGSNKSKYDKRKSAKY